MVFDQVSKRMIQHHLVPVYCLGLKARGVSLNGQFCVKCEQVLWKVCCGCLGNVLRVFGG